LSRFRGGNERYEAGHGYVEDIEKLTQTATPVRGLLPQFCHDDPWFLLQHPNQKRLRVQRDNTPRASMLRPEMRKLKVTINGAPQWTVAASTCRSISSFVIRGIRYS
jgi:hypothetical protein